MATLKSFEEVTQLGENVEYPSGYNCIEVNGTGDERVEKIFEKITITGPSTMWSNGVPAQLYVTIFDPNSQDPFYLAPGQLEEVSMTERQELSVQYWIVGTPRVFSDQAQTDEVPTAYLEWTENKIHIKDGWSEAGSPPGMHGMNKKEAWVLYNGQHTISVSDGARQDRWWDPSSPTYYLSTEEPKEDEENGVVGELLISSNPVKKCKSGMIGLSNIRGQNNSATFFYLPESGDEGVAYINVEWAGTTAIHTIIVNDGSFAKTRVSLEAVPSTVVPETGVSNIKLTAQDEDGGPLKDGKATFYIQSGNGKLNPMTAEIKEFKDQEESTNSSSKTQFSLSKPIIRLQSVVVVGGGFTLNNQYTVSGSTVTLVNQEFANEVVPLEVVYDWGGVAYTTYTATGTKDGDEIYIGGKIGSGANDLCTVNIDTDADSGIDIWIKAADNDIAKLASTDVECSCWIKETVNEEEVITVITSGVEFYTVPVNKGLLTMKIDNAEIVGEEASLTNATTFSVNHFITSVSKVMFLGTEYNVASFENKEIVIDGSFNVAAGTVFVDYVPRGRFKDTYTAIDEDYYVTLNAEYEGEIATDEVKVGDPPDKTPNIQMSADPEKITRAQVSEIRAQLNLQGAPAGAGKEIDFQIVDKKPGRLALQRQQTPPSLIPTPSQIYGAIPGSYEVGPPITELKADTNAEGIATVYLFGNGDGTGTAVINASHNNIGGSVSVPITAPTTTEKPNQYMWNITGTLDPHVMKQHGDYVLSGGASVVGIGLAEYIDEYGCVDTDPANLASSSMIKIRIRAPYAQTSLVDVNVSGGSYTPKPYFLESIDVFVPWAFEVNTNKNVVVKIIDKLNNRPISGATVKMGATPATTGITGEAVFGSMTPGLKQMSITHPNYSDNRLGIEGGSGSADDDPKNDSYTVQGYSERDWLLKPTTIDIKVTYYYYGNAFIPT